MKASLETSALFLSTTLELKNFVSTDLNSTVFCFQTSGPKILRGVFLILKPLAHSNQCSSQPQKEIALNFSLISYAFGGNFQAIRKLS